MGDQVQNSSSAQDISADQESATLNSLLQLMREMKTDLFDVKREWGKLSPNLNPESREHLDRLCYHVSDVN